MKSPKASRTTKAFEKGVASKPAAEYLLRLYVAGNSSRSRQAIRRAHALCEGQLKGRCKLEVIDVYQQPIRVRDGHIVATPTLVKELPVPVRQLIGTLATTSRLFVGLGLDAPDPVGR